MPKRVLIVGGVAAGASAATKARREDEEAEICLFERGPYVSFANCGLPYYISGEINHMEDLLVVTPKRLEDRFNLQVFVNHAVRRVDPKKRQIYVEDLERGGIKTHSYDSLILAPGAYPIAPPFPGRDAPNFFMLRTIPDAEDLKKFIDEREPKRALIVGGGFIGLEALEAFTARGIGVTLVEMLPHVLPNMDPETTVHVEEEMSRMGAKIILGNGVKSFEKDSSGLIKKTILENGRRIACDLVLLSIGVRPDVKLAKESGVEMGATGAIKVNDRMETSVRGIFAAGDAVESLNLVTGKPGWFALAGPANQQGRVAGANAVGKDLRFRGTLGTFIVRIGKIVAAKTGLSEREAQTEGYDFITVLNHPMHHATYYPGAKTLHMKLVAEKGSGRVLGAQVVGEEGVDKRIDVLATAIFFGAKIGDLGDLNLAYAPPFGAARDPVNQAGLVGSHLISGEVEAYHPVRAKDQDGEDVVFLDVRTPKEWEKGTIPNALKIPVDELRKSLPEVKAKIRGRCVVPYCMEGYRSYIAYRMLKQKSVECVKNYAGGYLSYLSHRAVDIEE